MKIDVNNYDECLELTIEELEKRNKAGEKIDFYENLSNEDLFKLSKDFKLSIKEMKKNSQDTFEKYRKETKLLNFLEIEFSVIIRHLEDRINDMSEENGTETKKSK